MQFISLDLAANLTVLTLANSCGKGVEVPPTCTIQNDVLMTATLTEKGLYNCQGRVIQVSDSNLLTWRFRAPTNVYAGRKCFFVNLFFFFCFARAPTAKQANSDHPKTARPPCFFQSPGWFTTCSPVGQALDFPTVVWVCTSSPRCCVLKGGIALLSYHLTAYQCEYA